MNSRLCHSICEGNTIKSESSIFKQQSNNNIKIHEKKLKLQPNLFTLESMMRKQKEKKKKKQNFYSLIDNVNYQKFLSQHQPRSNTENFEQQQIFQKSSLLENQLSYSFSTLAIFPESQSGSKVKQKFSSLNSEQKKTRKFISIVSQMENYIYKEETGKN